MPANYSQYPRGYFDVIWASPPCTEYSQAKTRGVRRLGEADLRIVAMNHVIGKLNPTYWFVENPVSRDPFGLRYRAVMADLEPYRMECSYCQYGTPYRKRTHIWTNAQCILLTCSKAAGFCDFRKQNGRHAETAQAGPSRDGTPGSGGARNVYPLPAPLLRALFRSLKFSHAISAARR